MENFLLVFVSLGGSTAWFLIAQFRFFQQPLTIQD